MNQWAWFEPLSSSDEEHVDSDTKPSPVASSSRLSSSSSSPDNASFPPVSQLKRDPVAAASEESKASASDSEDDEEDAIFYDSQEIQDIIRTVTAAKQKGNTEFGQGRWQDALVTYKTGLGDLPFEPKKTAMTSASSKGKERAASDDDDAITRDGATEGQEGDVDADEQDAKGHDEDEDASDAQISELRAALNANCAACLLKLERWKEAVDACDEALEDDPHYIKALSRRATANEAIGSWSSLQSALDDYKTLSNLPIAGLQRANVEKALRRLPPLIQKQQDKEKEEVLGKLKDLGNTFLGKFGLSTENFKFQEQPGGGYSMNFVK